MDNDDLREEEESLLDEMAKKGISTKIKTIPLGPKMLLIGIFGGIIFFLLIFIVLASLLSMVFFFDGTIGSGSSNLSYINSNAEDNYWWPIGGTTVETSGGKKYATGTPSSTIITSYFSTSRTIEGVTKPHYGIDIGSTTGSDYIIAIAKGTIYQVGTGCNNAGGYGNTCNGGYGNYVMIEHPGSVYTIYAHLYPDSITVSKGDSVDQGQIIGVMGNSGSSTGTHLHFQIEVGGRSSSNAVDPLNYVSTNTPRPVTVISGSNTGATQLLSMLQSWEGTGPMKDNRYVVYDDGTGTLTVGHGVTLKYNVERFKKRGIDVSTLKEGSKLDKSIVDSIELEIVNEKKSDIESMLINNSILLKDYQIDALVIRAYNVGNVDSFPEKYKTYGNTLALYDNYMSTPVIGGGQYLAGLDRRRQAEWNLFYNGIYTFNS